MFFILVEITFKHIVPKLFYHQSLVCPTRRHHFCHNRNLSYTTDYLIQLIKTEHRTAQSHLRNHQKRNQNVNCYSRIECRRNVKTHHIGKHPHRKQYQPKRQIHTRLAKLQYRIADHYVKERLYCRNHHQNNDFGYQIT